MNERTERLAQVGLDQLETQLIEGSSWERLDGPDAAPIVFVLRDANSGFRPNVVSRSSTGAADLEVDLELATIAQSRIEHMVVSTAVGQSRGGPIASLELAEGERSVCFTAPVVGFDELWTNWSDMVRTTCNIEIGDLA